MLLDLASEQYFGLNPVGTRIWELLDTHAMLAPIAETLSVEFDAHPATISTDLLVLITELLAAGLVKVP